MFHTRCPFAQPNGSAASTLDGTGLSSKFCSRRGAVGSKRNHGSASAGTTARPPKPQGGRSHAKATTTRHCLVPVLSRSAKTSFPGRKDHSAALRDPFRQNPKEPN